MIRNYSIVDRNKYNVLTRELPDIFGHVPMTVIILVISLRIDPL